MARPSIYARGVYVLNSPWSADSDTIYSCQSIRSFEELHERNIDPFEAFYQPKGLSQSDFQQDADAAATIVTLISEDGTEVIYVPDTYIASFPDTGNIPYHHVILSVDLGGLPETLGLDLIKQQIATTAIEVIGAEAEVNTHIAPTTGTVTNDEHLTLEAARLANIETTRTDRQKYLEQREYSDALEKRIETLETILKENNLISEVTQ